MHLMTVAFLVDQPVALPDFSKHKLFFTGMKSYDVGDNFFCTRCGDTLTAKDVAAALDVVTGHTQIVSEYVCSDCAKENAKNVKTKKGK